MATFVVFVDIDVVVEVEVAATAVDTFSRTCVASSVTKIDA